MRFFSLIVENKFPLDNIYMLLFWRLCVFMIVTIHLKCETWKKQSAFGNQDIDCFMQIFCILWVVLNMLVSCPRLTQKAF